MRVMFQDLSNNRALSDPLLGRFRTAPTKTRPIRFLWSGDTAGQGWGINPEFGGMKIYEAMRQTHPDFFIHSGDNIYADGPIQEFVTAENSKTWHNIVTPEVAKVAETLAEYRGRYNTTCWTKTFVASMLKCRKFGSGTITKSSTTGPTPKIYRPTRATARKTCRC
jgi:phosphodiesterase/alkaline phosphatase D-like protein